MEHRATICMVAELQEAGGSLRVQGRELPGHGAARMHHHTAQKVFMRWLLVTDHRRLMYVAILAQLSKHEVRNVLPRYSGGFVRISAEKDLVLTRGTLVSDPGWAHDHPL